MQLKTEASLLQARVPVSVHQALRALAQQQDRSVNWIVNKILADAVSKMKPEDKQ